MHNSVDFDYSILPTEGVVLLRSEASPEALSGLFSVIREQSPALVALHVDSNSAVEVLPTEGLLVLKTATSLSPEHMLLIEQHLAERAPGLTCVFTDKNTEVHVEQETA